MGNASDRNLIFFIDKYNKDEIKNFLKEYPRKIGNLIVIGSEKSIPEEWVKDIVFDIESVSHILQSQDYIRKQENGVIYK